MMMRVLFDYQGLICQRFGGVSLYFSQIVSHFPPNVTPVLGLRVSPNIYVQHWPHVVPLPKAFRDESLLPQMVKRSRIFRSLRYRYMREVNKRFLIELLASREYDLFHTTYDQEEWWLSLLNGKPFVYTVHDMIPELFEPDSPYLRRRKRIAERADRIIAVSENTKRDCVRLWKIPPEKIEVIHHAPSVVPARAENGGGAVDNNYILYVGGRDGYKNFEWFVIELAPLLRARKNLRLFCAGQPFSKQELTLLTRLDVRSQASAGFVDCDAMFALYRHALLFIYPSRYEGFGMPIFDSFSAGCPVLLADSSCFREVGGDAALYFCLDRPDQFRRQVEILLDNGTLKNSLVARGFERIKGCSWKITAEKTAKVYERVLGL